jgi:hypothetical protein
MSRGIFSRRKLDPFVGSAIRLGPGERMIGGRIFYSAAWLSPAPSQQPAPGTGKRGSDAAS